MRGDYLLEREVRVDMPTYDYECTSCRDEFCVEQGMNDKPLKKCRKCGGRLQKLLPRSLNLIFKGSGFYITDYGKGGAKHKDPARPAGKTVGSDKESS
jgi:putative FmdB family regulatory protein